MAYTDDGFPIIDDDHAIAFRNDKGTGYTGRDLTAYPRGSLKCHRAPGPKLDLATIKEMVKEKTAKKTWVSDLCDRVGSHVKNQQSSSYCWIHAPTRGMECQLVAQGSKRADGSPFVLSAFAAAWPIKHGSNQGGSGIEGIDKSLAAGGTCTEEIWPSMAFRHAVTPEVTANSALHVIEAWEDLDPSDYLQIWTNIVLNKPVTVGIPAWGHEVLLTFLVLNADGSISEGFDNSWGTDWGKNGRGVLAGAKRRFDEAGSIAAIRCSAN